MGKLSLRKILTLKVASIGIIALLCLFGFNFFKEYNRNRQLNNEIKKLEDLSDDLEAKNLAILNLAKYLDTEEFLETEARTKLGLQKAGEKAIIVKLPDTFAATGTPAEGNGLLTNPVKWWKYFFGR